MYNIFKNVKADVQFGLLSLNAFFFVCQNKFQTYFLFRMGAKETAFNLLSWRYVSNCLYNCLIQKYPDTYL